MKYRYIILLLLWPTLAFAANKQIFEFPDATLPLTDSEYVPLSQNGNTVKTPLSNVVTPTPGSSGDFIVNSNGHFGSVGASQAQSLISRGLLLDPRAYGAKCTGWYGIKTSFVQTTPFLPGTNFAVGDTFLVQDTNLDGHVRGGLNATGHVTSVDGGGGVISFVIDTPGSGYIPAAMYVTPTKGVGRGFAITPFAVITGNNAPTTTLASGGGSSGTVVGSTISGSAYAVGDTFAIPNPAQDGNYMTGRVDTVNTSGAVLTYHINNPGGDYAIQSAAPTITITGYGAGLTINITNATSSNSTWDDTYGFANAASVATPLGGAVAMPDNCWVANLMVMSGTTIYGQAWAPNYGYNTVPNRIDPSIGPHMFAIGTPAYILDWNGQSNVSLIGFEARGYTGNGFGNNTTWTSTVCIGSRNGGGAAGGLGGGVVSTFMMSAKNCAVGAGTIDGGGSPIFARFENDDWGANNIAGIYGSYSDFVDTDDTFASETTGIWLTGFGLIRIQHPRTEYVGTGIRLDNFNSLQTDIINWQHDRSSGCALMVTNSLQIKLTGGALKAAGLAGTLTVTGAANNGSGLIRLTVTGVGNNANGGATPTSGLVTGDKANISGVVGTTEANANQWTITVIDGTHIDLQGSAFSNAYVSGGLGNVNGKGSYICTTNSTDIHADNVGFYGFSAGANFPAASIIDGVTSSSISINTGAANLGTGNSGGYRQAIGNWHNAGNTPPANFIYDVSGSPAFRNDNAQTGIGFISGGTKFTATGCTPTNTVGGATAGKFTIGANTCSVVITMNGATGLGLAPITGFSCRANDETTTTANIVQTGSNATTATFLVPAGANSADIIDFSCTGFQ